MITCNIRAYYSRKSRKLEEFDRFSTPITPQNPSYYSIVESCHGIAVIFRTKINRYSIFDAERMVLERKIILLFVSIGRGWRGRKKEEPFKYRVALGNKEVQLRFIIAPALRFVSPAAGFNAKFIVDREVRWEEN